MNTKSNLFTIVLEEHDALNDKHISQLDIYNYFQKEDYYNFYAFLLHDKDVDEFGVLKHKHYHIVIETKNTYGKNTIINEFAKAFMINKDCISVRCYEDINDACAYLIHLNDAGKHQYSRCAVITSDKKAYYDYVDLRNIPAVTINTIHMICGEAQSLTDVYQRVGINNAKNYRFVIKDIWDDVNRYNSNRKEK